MPETRHLRIEAPDGIGLAATLYLPDREGPDREGPDREGPDRGGPDRDAADGGGPWPALLEALPYRKDDITASYRPEYLRLAEAGYVVCRLDVRGTGSSEGIATDEYPATERTDLLAVIDWLASQPWSTGRVGMFGTSYSGFNSLQLAMERPPALRAIVSIFASDDRYGDDVHYFGGAVKQLDIVDYPSYMVASNALPPVPAVYGEGWREVWERRVASSEPWLFAWLEHQRYDDYWRYGSTREDYGAIEAATMIVGGWADGYTNIALRSFPELRCPRRILIGPWPHAAVETCRPGPNIDLVPEMLRWWDRWLKDVDTGVDEEPPIIVYAQRSTLPDPLRAEVRGDWRYEPTWPPARLVPTTLELGDAEPGGLAHGEGPDTLEVRGDVGSTAWISCAGGMPWGQSSDQRPDEAFSLTFTWDALDDELEILGHPVLRIRVRSDHPVAYLSAKVCDVFPDGTSSLVVRGLLNLTHRDSRSDPTPMPSGEWVDIELELEACAWAFEAGHRIRLDLAGADWPNAWAPPTAATLEIDRAGAGLQFPVLSGPAPIAATPSLPSSTSAQRDPRERGIEDAWRWEIVEDVVGRERRAVATYGGDEPADREVPAMRTRYGGSVGVSLDDPGRAWADGETDLEIGFPEATCRASSRVRMDSDAETYRVALELVVSEDGVERWRRTWERVFARDLQ